MAKVRKLTNSQSERFHYNFNHHLGMSAESSELQEDDMWQTVNEEWAPRAETRLVDRHLGGLSLEFESPRGHHVASSAPVNVPDCSKIHRVDSAESMNDSDDMDEGEYEMVPPHEYLAREYRKIVGSSVLEGVGRTLKGRDMSRVRDAVWRRTGFDG